tara:strand:- start:220 stop:399 length:180 start_codon:yes stop_codon:yes gene_type:complete
VPAAWLRLKTPQLRAYGIVLVNKNMSSVNGPLRFGTELPIGTFCRVIFAAGRFSMVGRK